MPDVSVIIVNYNSGDRLGRCLDCLKAQTFQDFETIVIDNASSDGSLERARTNGPAAHIINAGENLGFAAANNRAAQKATGAWLAFLNPDAYAAPDWLEQLMAATKRHPWADAIGSTQLQAGDAARIDGAGDVFHIFGVPYRGHYGWPADKLPPEGECFSPCAAAALYRRQTFEALGGFDEDFFCYGEDVDLGFRLRLAGGRAVQTADAIVYHEGSAVAGRNSEFAVYYGNRNRIWTAYKNMPGVVYWPLLPVQFAVNCYLLARSWGAGIGPAYWRALKDGYGGLGALRNKRRALQQDRRVRISDLMKSLAWSPIKIVRREAVLRPIANDDVAEP
ncbi:MAG: glycosyltransferase family 2 protein [Parvularculaceae bacterium]